ncbi:hypothetical protein V6N11_051913 [Hibiscus sabdariffa]|uniref:DUF4283 domain-containing protein n=1 Tax=Hibiscus sabdariffa TaxID=183260 RepID=A0ABR2U8N7_9ROSI
MASNTSFTPFIDLDLTAEEQSFIFTPNVDWDIPTIDPAVLLIGKLFATKEIDNQLFLRAYFIIWKKDNLLSISHIGEKLYCIHFDNAAKCTEILNRGPRLFKSDWFALAHFNPTLGIQDHVFNTMNVWFHIHDLPTILMDFYSMAIKTGSFLGSLIGNVTKIDTMCIDGIELPTLDKEPIAEPVQPSDEGSTANPTHLSSEFHEPLDELLIETDISDALDVLAPTPLTVVKPDGETTVAESPN